VRCVGPRSVLLLLWWLAAACDGEKDERAAKVAAEVAKVMGTCGQLADDADPDRVLVPLDAHGDRPQMIEVIDPLCRPCAELERRLAARGLDKKIHRLGLLIPLDSKCNWMVPESLHPGACAVSQAILCAGDRAPQVLAWAYEQQETLTTAGRQSQDAAAHMAAARFPDLASCIGSPTVQQRLNKGLRFAVRNQLETVTPQVFVNRVKLCDRENDPSLEDQLAVMLESREP
jgi:hypothetical protein